MFVLHGSVFWPARRTGGPDFFVWGEETPDEWVGTKRHGRRPKPDLHPFAAGCADLARALSHLRGDGEEGGRAARPVVWGKEGVGYPERVLTVALPSRAGWPLPSPLVARLALDEEGPEGEVQLLPWLVRGLVLAPPPAAVLLLGLGRGMPLPQGVTAGPDLVYWSRVSGFLQELLVRHRFLPVLKEDLDAGWRMVPGTEDAGRLALLTAAMPPACRAPADGGKNGPAPAGRLVEGFLQAAGSGLIRGYLAGESRDDPRLAALARGLPHERWLAAVVTGAAAVAVPTEQLKSLAARLDEWTRPVLAPTGGLRTGFRLVPPPRDGAPWSLAFFLQAVDDPSLVVPAERVGEPGGDSAVLWRCYENPADRLRTDLGVACRLFPPLEAALQGRPGGPCPLSLPETYQFLKQAAPAFVENGLAVQLPALGRGRNLGVRLTLKPRGSGAGDGRLGLDTLVDFQWELALGGESLSLEEFRQLSALKVPLVCLRGQWIELASPGAVEETLRLLENKAAGPVSVRDALRLAGGCADGANLPVLEVAADGWLGDLLARPGDGRQIASVAPPAGFCGELRPYQLRGLAWLSFLSGWGVGACLADDMGLGKTIQTIALLLHRRERKGRRTVLLVCPTAVVGNWARELARFAPGLNVLVHHGPGRRVGGEFAAADCDVVVTTYTVASRDADFLSGVAWAGVVLDEAQNIKNPGALRTRSVKRLPADFRLALTGTPVENRLFELWSILDFLNPGLLGSAGEFQEKFALPIERWRDEPKTRELATLVRPFILRRHKSDPQIIADLPAKQEGRVYCSLTREQVTLYGAVVREMLERIAAAAGIARRGLVLAALTNLKQVCNHPAQYQKDGGFSPSRSGKMVRLIAMLEELLACGEAALVFTQFVQMGEILRLVLGSYFGEEILFLHGGLAREARERLVACFQGGDGPNVLIASLKAGGVGVNLTRANHVFHFDRWWNPAVEDQATDRAYRIGQARNVFVYKFVCSGTLEERIDDLIEEKRLLSAGVIGGGEDWLTGLSTDELREVLTLGANLTVED